MSVTNWVAVLVLLAGAGLGFGADTQPAPVSGAAAGVAAMPGGAALSNETLKGMLEGMNYAPKVQSKGYLIAVKKDDWTFYVTLVISGDETKVGLNANLGLVENPEAVTAAQWRALLMSNTDIDPSFFYYDEKLKRVMLHRVLDNRGITPEILKGQIEQFTENIRNTEAVWSFTK